MRCHFELELRKKETKEWRATITCDARVPDEACAARLVRESLSLSEAAPEKEHFDLNLVKSAALVP